MDAHLRDLRYFVAVAEELSFTRAAERLHLSQPALSKQIRGLETTLRARLFRRDRRQVELTAAGAALHAVARGLLQDWDDGVAAVGDAAAQDARIVRVGTLTSIGRALYPAITEQFAKRQPGWQVELRTFGWGDPTAGLGDRTTDAAFVWLPIDTAEIETTVLATERRFVAISARHPLAGRRTIEFSEIASEPVAALPASAGSQRDFWLAADARAGRPPRVVAEVSAADEKFEIVSSGAAITLLAEGNAGIYPGMGSSAFRSSASSQPSSRSPGDAPTAGPRSRTSSRPAATRLAPRTEPPDLSRRMIRTAIRSTRPGHTDTADLYSAVHRNSSLGPAAAQREAHTLEGSKSQTAYSGCHLGPARL
jgi:DNA-binding transcriptional LysR family regulator